MPSDELFALAVTDIGASRGIERRNGNSGRSESDEGGDDDGGGLHYDGLVEASKLKRMLWKEWVDVAWNKRGAPGSESYEGEDGGLGQPEEWSSGLVRFLCRICGRRVEILRKELIC